MYALFSSSSSVCLKDRQMLRTHARKEATYQALRCFGAVQAVCRLTVGEASDPVAARAARRRRVTVTDMVSKKSVGGWLGAFQYVMKEVRKDLAIPGLPPP
jgi:hypothetical protein